MTIFLSLGGRTLIGLIRPGRNRTDPTARITKEMAGKAKGKRSLSQAPAQSVSVAL